MPCEDVTKEQREDIKNWKQKKDPEPQRDEKVIMSRKEMEIRGIPHIPFYKVVDFTIVPLIR